MTDPMDLSRFRALAGAYGASTDRWPGQHRAAARVLAADPAGRAVLVNAAMLDEALDAWRVPAPSADLAARVAASAPAAPRRVPRRARLWWSGLGIATALAGAAAGTAAVAALFPAPDAVEAGSAFGDPGPDAAS